MLLAIITVLIYLELEIPVSTHLIDNTNLKIGVLYQWIGYIKDYASVKEEEAAASVAKPFITVLISKDMSVCSTVQFLLTL